MEPHAQHFGRYRLMEVIGAGGMAEVFLAKMEGPEGFERKLAIKRILPHYSKNDSFVRMFIDEARLVGHFTHPNIVQTYDFGIIDECYYLSMEYVDGINLADILTRYKTEKKVVPIEVILEVAIQACRGIDYAHKETDENGKPLGIIHRDLTPHNLLISRKGVVKITDFGIAKASMNTHMTQAGMIKGKVPYMSPEQAMGLPLTHVSDIFAIGIVLYEACTLKRLFEGENDFTILRKVQEAAIPSICEQNKTVPLELERIIMKALARDREQRYKWASEMEADLMQLKFSYGSLFQKFSLADFVQDFIATRTTGASKGVDLKPGEAEAGLKAIADGLGDVDNPLDLDQLARRIGSASGDNATVMLKISEDGQPIEPVRVTEDAGSGAHQASGADAFGFQTPSEAASEAGSVANQLLEMPLPVMPSLELGALDEQNNGRATTAGLSTLEFPPVSHKPQVSPVFSGELSLAGAMRVKHRRSQKLLQVALLAIGLVAMAVAAIAYMTPTTGSVMVDVVPSDAEVLVNGKVADSMRPLMLTELPDQTALTIVVRKPGFKELQQQVTVQAGEQTSVPLTLEAETRYGHLSVQSEPAGARVLLNGKKTEYVTPCQLNLAPDTVYSIGLQLEGYALLEKELSVKEGSQETMALAMVKDQPRPPVETAAPTAPATGTPSLPQDTALSPVPRPNAG